MSDDALKLSAFLDRVDGALRLLSALGDTGAVAVRAGPGLSLYAVLYGGGEEPMCTRRRLLGAVSVASRVRLVP
jgi:hypothetical protein